MKITCSVDDRIATVRLEGELDHHAAGEVIDRAEALIDGCFPLELIFDMSAVSFMDSSGIAVVLGSYRRMRAVGGSVRLTGIPRQSEKVLLAAGIDKILKIS